MALASHCIPMLLPCDCHAIAMPIPIPPSCDCHAIAVLPCYWHAIPMPVLMANVVAMVAKLLPWLFPYLHTHTTRHTHIHTCAYTYLRTYNLRCGERPLQTMPTVRGERPTLQRASPAMQQGGVSPAMQQGGVEASLPCRDQVVYEDSGADMMPQNPSQLTRALCKCRRGHHL
jgi:hypothetical protein